MLEPYVMKPSIRPPLFRLYRESVAYQDNVALKNISLQIDWGEKVAFIGPSGAGKTTLLRTLYERAANDAAFVHQHYALVPQLSVFHNVYIGRLDGQQQRVAVARAVYRGEDILFADEPVSSVDPHQADMVLQLIVQNAETVVLSLHAVGFALKFAERIIGLRNGEIQFDLPVEKVTQAMLSELYQNADEG